MTDHSENDPVAYARAHVTSPATHALLDEVERGQERRAASAGIAEAARQAAGIGKDELMTEHPLVAFGLARLAEEEAAAATATPGEWAALDSGVMSIDDESQWPVSITQSDRDRADRVHIALHDPARVLREVAAKRAILSEHHPWMPRNHGHDSARCTVCLSDRGGWQEDWHADLWPCKTVRLLGAIWSDHDGYDPSWAPED